MSGVRVDHNQMVRFRLRDGWRERWMDQRRAEHAELVEMVKRATGTEPDLPFDPSQHASSVGGWYCMHFWEALTRLGPLVGDCAGSPSPFYDFEVLS